MNKILLAVVALFTLSGGPSSTGAVTTQLTGEVNKAMVEQVHQALDSTTGPVTIYITSLGGSLFSAIEIENAIGDHGNVTCIARGFAASAALSILESCQVREMTPETVLMAHQVAVGSGDSSRETDADNTKKVLRALDYGLCIQLTRHAKITSDKMCKMIANGKEVWLIAPDALKLGLVDKVL